MSEVSPGSSPFRLDRKYMGVSRSYFCSTYIRDVSIRYYFVSRSIFLSAKDNGIKSFFKLDEWMTFRPSSSQEQKIFHCNWHFISLQRLNFDILKCKKWVILQWGSTPFIWSRFHVSKIRKWHVRGVGFNFFSFEKFKSERELNGLLESRLGQNRLECRVRDA